MILINCGNFSMFVSEAGHYKDGGEGSLHFDVDSSLSLHNSIYIPIFTSIDGVGGHTL